MAATATMCDYTIPVCDMAATEGERSTAVVEHWCRLAKLGCYAILMLVCAVSLIGIIYLCLLLSNSDSLDYSVAVTGVVPELVGTAPAAARAPAANATGGGRQPASPVLLFNLTVRMKNPSKLFEACRVAGGMGVVSHDGRILGVSATAAGTETGRDEQPFFCVDKRGEREDVVPMYARHGADADALRGPEAALDLVVCRFGFKEAVACRVAVGGGALSPCTSARAADNESLCRSAFNCTILDWDDAAPPPVSYGFPGCYPNDELGCF